MPSGDQLRKMLDHWDFEKYADRFTGMEMSQMHRAATGDYNWMYDKRGNPRAGWIKLWTMKKCDIAKIDDISRWKRQEIKTNEERMAAGKKPINFGVRRFWIWTASISGLWGFMAIINAIGDALQGA